MLACYSGICSTSATPASSMESNSESCHNMDKHQDSQNNRQLMQNFNETVNDSSTCCFDSLLTSTDDNYVKDFAILTPTVLISDHFIVKDNLRIKHMSLREHDPPDLQVLHSTFQI